MMNIVNFTPHDINIINCQDVEFLDKKRKYTVKKKYRISKTIKSEGMLSVSFDIIEKKGIKGIPVKNKIITGIDKIPDGCDIAIVSGLYGGFSEDPRCYTVIDPVYSADFRTVVGCLAIGKVEK